MTAATKKQIIKVLECWLTLDLNAKLAFLEPFTRLKQDSGVLNVTPIFRDICLFDLLATKPEMVYERMMEYKGDIPDDPKSDGAALA